MTQPRVACVMLANGRPEMVARAIECWRNRSYNPSFLQIYDSGEHSTRSEIPLEFGANSSQIRYVRDKGATASIGTLRNRANELVTADIICHWDSDDWSHPNRIAEQIALLQSIGAECVGYNEMLFWRQNPPVRGIQRHPENCECGTCGEGQRDVIWIHSDLGESWLYRAAVPNYAIGTSMCYWRETWQRHPFPDRSEGCDDLEWFNRGVKITSYPAWVEKLNGHMVTPTVEPLMIASIHGGNTCAKIDPKAREWQRVQEWDAYCREAMQL